MEESTEYAVSQFGVPEYFAAVPSEETFLLPTWEQAEGDAADRFYARTLSRIFEAEAEADADAAQILYTLSCS